MELIYDILLKKIIKKINKKFIGSLEVIIKSKKSFLIGKKENNLKFYIKHKGFLSSLLFYGLPYLGIAYSKGYWSTNNLKNVLEIGIRNKNIFRNISFLNMFIKFYEKIIILFENNTLKKSKKQISFHYDLGNNFYKLWLDETMTYSSAIFNNSKNLISAQNNKYKNIVIAGEINKDHSILEIGCGWGGFIKYIEKNIGSNVTGITLSKKQYAYINNCKFKNSLVKLKDYRNINNKFDRIVSIEMFEAVGKKNWNTYFKKLKECITDRGKIILQIITISEENYNYYSKRKDFIQQYVFPGGMLPTKSSLERLAYNNNLFFKEHLSFGKDYSKTLALWKKNFLNNWNNIEKLGFDNNFKRLWEYYLTYCEVGFNNGTIDVSQFILEKNKN